MPHLLPMRPGSLPDSTSAIPVDASRPRMALRPLRPPTGTVDASSASPAASRDPKAHLPPRFPTTPCYSAPTPPRPSVPPATPMPPDAPLSASESHPHSNPLSIPLHPAYTEPDVRCGTSLPVTTRQMDTRQTCSAAHTLEDPCTACALRYDLFITETLFDPADADETPPLAAVNALAEEYRGDVLSADCCLKSLFGNYMEDHNPHTGDNPQLDLNALASPPRRSARLFAAHLAAETIHRLSSNPQPSTSTSSTSPKPSVSASSACPQPSASTPSATTKTPRRDASSASAPKPQEKRKASKPKAPTNKRRWMIEITLG